VGESLVVPSVPTDHHVLEELSLFARKPDPETRTPEESFLAPTIYAAST
jgi:hypothetical protein